MTTRPRSLRRCTAAFLLLLLLTLGGNGAFAAPPGEVPFTVLHTNDEHSTLLPYPLDGDAPLEAGGFARLATAIDSVRREKEEAGEPVVLLGAGDFLGETAFGWLTLRGEAPELRLLQQMGYDAVAIGNHEFDFGPEHLAGYLRAAGYPAAHGQTAVLGANIHPPAGHPLAQPGLLRSWIMIDLPGGLQLGIFGLLGEDAISVTTGQGDVSFGDPLGTAARITGELRRDGADLVVALTHAGLANDRELARKVPGIDLIVGGHSHDLLTEPVTEGETLIVQAGYRTTHLGVLELAFCRDTGRLRVRNPENDRPFVLPLDETFPPDPAIASRIEGYSRLLGSYLSEITGGEWTDVGAPVVRSPLAIRQITPGRETAAGNFITDAMRQTAGEVTGHRVDVAIQANGAIRGSLIPRTGPDDPGVLTFYDITNAAGLGYGADGYPGYSLISTWLTGEELRRVLEVAVLLPELLGDEYFLQFSGLAYRYRPADAVLFRIPFTRVPVPSTRAVRQAGLFRGDGIQPAGLESLDPLLRGDDTLYHVVTDTYILSFLPMAGELLPALTITPRDAQGRIVPPERYGEMVIRHQGRELKVWEAVVRYAASQPVGAGGHPEVPAVYGDSAGRIVPVGGIPLAGWLLLGLAALGAGLVGGLRRWRRARARARVRDAA